MTAPDLGITDEAAEAAATVLARMGGFEVLADGTYSSAGYNDDAREVLAAAVPLLQKAWEQELRQQIANQIEAEARAVRERIWAAGEDLRPLARIMHAEVDGRILAARRVRSATSEAS